MKNLLRMMYTSKASGHVDNADLNALVEKSIGNNYPKRITGVLSYGNGSFLQVLEGPETDVITLYSRIITDRRHHDCVILNIDLIERRLFSNWAMGYVSDVSRITQGYNELLDYRQVREDQSDTRNLMNLLAEILRD